MAQSPINPVSFYTDLLDHCDTPERVQVLRALIELQIKHAQKLSQFYTWVGGNDPAVFRNIKRNTTEGYMMINDLDEKAESMSKKRH